MCCGSAVRSVWSRRFGAAQTMHSHKCDHVKFLLAHSQKMVANAGRSLEPWLMFTLLIMKKPFLKIILKWIKQYAFFNWLWYWIPLMWCSEWNWTLHQSKIAEKTGTSGPANTWTDNRENLSKLSDERSHPSVAFVSEHTDAALSRCG